MLYKQFFLEQFLLEKYFVSVANCISKEIMSRFTRKSVSKSVTLFSRVILSHSPSPTWLMPKCLQHIILSQPIYRKYSKRKSLFSLKNIKQTFVCPCVIVSHEASASYGQQRFCVSSSHLPPMKLVSLIHFFPFDILYFNTGHFSAENYLMGPV